ncbi:CocE/NonD family hydrolase [Streptomyces sp. NPDC058701]|uniref:CocE/NonD family hydrolase n=1 Tax=Streptomyces sp. NPDC058701 TaxID=3346608 RepID=UPI0036687654
MTTSASLSLQVNAPIAHAAQQSNPQYSYAKSIREKIWVQSTVDSDGTGDKDMISVDIVRPVGADGVAITDVPVIMDASPYYYNLGRGNQSQVKRDLDVDGVVDSFPLFYDNYFVTRGYAVALVDSSGTGRSDGCTDLGGPAERAAVKAAIDWFGGRTGGYRDWGMTQSVLASSWSSGKVGIIGKSWDATLANAMLTYGTDPSKGGLPNLRTVVPIAGISSWYDYYFSNGVSLRNGEAPSALAGLVANNNAKSRCKTAWAAMDKAAGYGTDSYGVKNAFWRDRDYVSMLWNAPVASGTSPGVFMVHGAKETNVKTTHFGELWDVVQARQMPHKLWLSQLNHVDPFDYDRTAWVATLHQWMDHWLKGIDTGIMLDANKPTIERNQAGAWIKYSNDWSLSSPGKADTVQYLPGPEKSFTASAGGQTEDSMYLDKKNLIYDIKSTPTRLSGRPQIGIRAKLQSPGTHLTVMLVDTVAAGSYFNRVDPLKADTSPICDNGAKPCDGALSVQTLASSSDLCNQTGEDAARKDSCAYRDVQRQSINSDFHVISRGWLDTRYDRATNTKHDNTAGVWYDFVADLTPLDYVLEQGHTLKLVIGGSDQSLTQVSTTSTTVTVDPARTYIEYKEAFDS